MNQWDHKRSIMLRYDVTAEMYNLRYSEEQKAKYEKVLKNVNAAGTVLDLGCGTGLLFSSIASQAEMVVAADVSMNQLLKAKEQAKTFDNICLIHADADNLPVKDNCFNVVFAFTVLQNMPKPAEALRELKRTAKYGGLIVVSGLKKTFSLEVFEALLKEAGLRLIFCEDNLKLNCYMAVGTQG